MSGGIRLLNVTSQQHRNPYSNVLSLALADALDISESLIQMRRVETIVTEYPALEVSAVSCEGQDHQGQDRPQSRA